MIRTTRTSFILSLLVLLACAPRYAEERKAMRLEPLEPAFEPPQIEMAKTMPPRFSVALEREMPTPGYTFTVDGLDVDPEARRIVARVTQHRPEGMVAQVLTPAWLKLDLGVLEPGRYFLELYLREDAGGKHRPAQAILLEAL